MADAEDKDSKGGRATHPGVRAPRVSSRVLQTIEGRAQDVRPPNPPPETQVDSAADTTSFEAADAPLDRDAPHVPPPEGPVLDAPMPAEPTSASKLTEPTEGFTSTENGAPTGAADQDDASADRVDPALTASTDLQPPRRHGVGLLLAGAALILIAAGVGLWAAMGQGSDDMLTNLRRMVGYDSAPVVPSPAASTVANAPKPASPATPSSVATPPAGTVATNSPKPASPPPAAPAASPVPSAPPASPAAAPSRPSTPVSPPVEARKPDATPALEPRKPESPAASLVAPAPSATSSAAAPAGDPRIPDLDRRLSDLDARIGALAAAPPKPAPDTTAALAVQATRLGGINDMLAALDKRLAALEQQLATPKNDARAPQAPDVRTRDIDASAAKVVVAQGLLAAVTSGAPFAQPLAALRSLGVEDASLARLSASAASGVPSITGLRESFAVARTKLRAAPRPASDAGIGDKMMARLSSLVSIKPVAERSGPSTEAVASRVDGALGRGDLAGALAEIRMLPPSDAALVKDWTDSATKRADAEADARAQLAAAVAALAKPRS